MNEEIRSPASGRVIRIQRSGKFDPQTFKKRLIKNASHAVQQPSGKFNQNASIEGERIVSIFMHLHNVHLTTAPLDGVVKKITPEKGNFKPAFLRSSDFNTKNTIKLSTNYGDIKIVQIAGFFTRKIICEVKEGQIVQKGERIGKICLGSRVDLSIPEGFEILVKEGARVKCKKTSIASLETSSIRNKGDNYD
jgi:phosphatidylserine decarboxylase precursor-related protein